MQNGKDMAMKALTKLFLVFPQANGTDAERTARFAAYWEVLQTREPRFVVEACEYAAKGKLGEGRFLPTAGELFQCAEAFSARYAAARGPKVALCEPEVRNDPQTRARIIAGFHKLLADFKAGVPIDPGKATRDVFHPRPIDHSSPPVISDSLRACFLKVSETHADR